MTFYQWLLEQLDRDDRIGDLARDAVHDQWDRKRVAYTLSEWRERLWSLGACNGAIQALEDAWVEWRAYDERDYETVRAIELKALRSHTHGAREEMLSGIYFAQCSGTDRVKIGYSGDITRRLQSLSTSAPFPVVLLGYIAGEQSLERELHAAFAKHRKNGEWFELSREIRQFVSVHAVQA